MTPDEYIDWLLDQISTLEAQRDDAQADAAEWRRVLDERYAILLAEAEAAKAEGAREEAAKHADCCVDREERDRLAEALHYIARQPDCSASLKEYIDELLTPAPPSSTRNGGLSGE